MEIIITENYEELSQEAAKIFIDIIKNKKNPILGLATGSTPVGMYKELIKAHNEGLDFSNVVTFNLDEYIGLPAKHEQSYFSFMHENLYDHVNIPEENIHLPVGTGENPEQDAENYELLLQETDRADIQVLGIGSNGHIAFNEPGKELSLYTNIIELSESTIEANSRFFDSPSEVPTRAITMGMESVFRAKKIVVLISGSSKKEAVDYLLNSNKISTFCPVSLLHLHHDVVAIIDKEALGK